MILVRMKYMNLLNVRIDERLVHGMVATYWLPTLKADRALCIDGESAADPIVKSALRLATPKNIFLSVIPLEKAIENLLEDRYGSEGVMVIAKTPEVIKSLVDAGVPISGVTVGNLGRIATPDDAREICGTISVSPQQKLVFDYLHEHGVDLTMQLVPTDNPVDFYPLLCSRFDDAA